MKKSIGIAYLLYFLGLFGWLGLHRFYLKKVGTGILWILTAGAFGFGTLYDLFSLGNQVREYNTELENEQLRREMRENMMMAQNAIAAAATSAAAAASSSIAKKEN